MTDKRDLNASADNNFTPAWPHLRDHPEDAYTQAKETDMHEPEFQFPATADTPVTKIAPTASSLSVEPESALNTKAAPVSDYSLSSASPVADKPQRPRQRRSKRAQSHSDIQYLTSGPTTWIQMLRFIAVLQMTLQFLSGAWQFSRFLSAQEGLYFVATISQAGLLMIGMMVLADLATKYYREHPDSEYQDDPEHTQES